MILSGVDSANVDTNRRRRRHGRQKVPDAVTELQ